MSSIRAIIYPIYQLIPKGANRQALAEWLLIVIALCLSLLILVSDVLVPTPSAIPASDNRNTHTTSNLTANDSSKTTARVPIAANKPSLLDQQAESWQQLDDIRLVGIIHSSARRSFAILGWDEQQLLLSMGESIPHQDSIYLSGIAADSITLTGPWGEKKLGLNGKEIVANPQHRQIKLPQLKKIILQQPDSISNHIQARPNYQDGKLKSLSLAPSTSAALFNQAGLQSGDQLTHINNTAIADMSITALPTLLRQGKLELRFNRDGQERQLTLSF